MQVLLFSSDVKMTTQTWRLCFTSAGVNFTPLPEYVADGARVANTKRASVDQFAARWSSSAVGIFFFRGFASFFWTAWRYNCGVVVLRGRIAANSDLGLTRARIASVDSRSRREGEGSSRVLADKFGAPWR